MISFALFVFTCVLMFHYLMKNKYSYWKKQGVKGPAPLPIVGNFGKSMFMLESVSELARNAYEKYPKEKIVGLYCGFIKFVVLRDPNIIKHILTKDSKYFNSRGLKTTDRGFSNNLITSEGEVWLALRKTFSPAFTSTKLKQMSPLIQKCVNKLLTETENQMEKIDDIKDLCDKYSLDTTSSNVFGLSLETYTNELNHFNQISKQFSEPSSFFWLWYAAEMVIPGIQSKMTKINFGSYLRSFFMTLVKTVISERENKGIKRNDLMNIMLDLKHKDKLNIGTNSPLEIRVDDNLIASQAFAFYVAGQETISVTLALILYELAMHEDIQDRAYKEICQVFDKHNKNDYDSIKEMNYLTMIYRETMRKYSSIGFLIRKATTDYIIPDTKIILKENTYVLVSLSGLHNDPKYFKDPEKFNPDNCSEENVAKLPHHIFMPFGDGPRNCIGSRFSEMQILPAVATFLLKYRLSPSNIPIKYSNSYVFLRTKGGIWVNLAKR